jgi:hypothetical protein
VIKEGKVEERERLRDRLFWKEEGKLGEVDESRTR